MKTSIRLIGNVTKHNLRTVKQSKQVYAWLVMSQKQFADSEAIKASIRLFGNVTKRNLRTVK